jgi:3-dehydroquinate dehydratase type I
VTAKICVSILPKDISEACSLIKKAENTHADLVEVRLDFIETPSKLSNIVSQTKTPLIATNKLHSEKGYFTGDENKRQQKLLNAAKSGFKYVDLNLSSPKTAETVEELQALGVKTIISYHKFDGMLNVLELNRILNKEVAMGANVCKIVTTAKEVGDNLEILNFVSSTSKKAKLVCFCMGELGKISRFLSPLFGAYFTFASLEQGRETAPGQMTIDEMKATYNLLEQK